MVGGQENHYLEHYFTSYFHSSPGLTESLQNPPIWGTTPSPCKGSIHIGDSGHEAKTLISSLPFWHSLWFWGRNTSGLPLWEELNTPLPSVICGIYGGSTEQQTLGPWKIESRNGFTGPQLSAILVKCWSCHPQGWGSVMKWTKGRGMCVYTHVPINTHTVPLTQNSLSFHPFPPEGAAHTPIAWHSLVQLTSSLLRKIVCDQTNAHNSG